MKEIKWVQTVDALPLERFRPHPRNPKIHSAEQLKHIRNSILTFGFLDPIGIWGDSQVVEGHGRLEALKQLVREGEIRIPEKGIPVIHLDHLTPTERDAYMLEHNQATMETPWDEATLAEILSGLEETLDMEGLFGFGEDEGPDMDKLIPPEMPGEMEEEGFKLLVECRDEEEMQAAADQLRSMGIPCRPMAGG